MSEVEIDSTKWKDRDFMGPEIDLIMSIDALKEENDNIRRIYQWEKAHQKQVDDESEERRINREADALATECRDNVYEGLIIPDKKLFMQPSTVSLLLQGNRITKNTKYEVHKVVHDNN